MAPWNHQELEERNAHLARMLQTASSISDAAQAPDEAVPTDVDSKADLVTEETATGLAASAPHAAAKRRSSAERKPTSTFLLSALESAPVDGHDTEHYLPQVRSAGTESGPLSWGGHCAMSFQLRM